LRVAAPTPRPPGAAPCRDDRQDPRRPAGPHRPRSYPRLRHRKQPGPAGNDL